MPKETYAVDERVRIWITGMAGEKIARVVGHDDFGYPKLKVEADPSWDPFTLKDGDYIIRGRV